MEAMLKALGLFDKFNVSAAANIHSLPVPVLPDAALDLSCSTHEDWGVGTQPNQRAAGCRQSLWARSVHGQSRTQTPTWTAQRRWALASTRSSPSRTRRQVRPPLHGVCCRMRPVRTLLAGSLGLLDYGTAVGLPRVSDHVPLPSCRRPVGRRSRDPGHCADCGPSACKA